MRKGFKALDAGIYALAVFLLVGSGLLGYVLFHKEGEPDLMVEDVYFGLVEEGEESSEIEIIIFISNIGDKEIDTLKIRAFTIETRSNLAMDEAQETLSNIPKKTSAEGKLKVRIPNRDIYRVEILIFRDGRFDIRVYGTIDLTAVGITADYKTDPGGRESEDIMAFGPVMSKDASSALCMFMLFLIGGVLILVVIIIAVRKSSKEKKNGSSYPREEDRSSPARELRDPDDGPEDERPQEKGSFDEGGRADDGHIKGLLGDLGIPDEGSSSGNEE